MPQAANHLRGEKCASIALKQVIRSSIVKEESALPDPHLCMPSWNIESSIGVSPFRGVPAPGSPARTPGSFWAKQRAASRKKYRAIPHRPHLDIIESIRMVLS